jgi:putative inorganic carbon (hco3(-)) transporter
VIDLARLGGPVACVGLGVLLVAQARRNRIAGFVFAIAGTCLLGLALAPDAPATIAVGVVVGLVVAGGLAAAFRRRPWLLPLAALACVPARLSVHVHGSGSKLLLPLYAIVLGATVLLGWELVRDRPRSDELRLAAWPLAAYVAWTGASVAWSQDVHAGAIELLAFYVPFTILALAIARLPWSALGVRALYAEVVVMALVFAGVGFYQYETRDIFQNPKVITSNAYAPFFRVNSVFWDPSVYGRFLVVAMVPTIVLLVRGRVRTRAVVAAVAAIAVTWLGLLISFSQSSFAALLVAVIGAAAVAWRWRVLIAIAVALALLAGIASSDPALRRSIQHHTSSGLNSATSGRASLVANGVRIFVRHPLVGVGVGGFKQAYAARIKRLHGKKNLSKAASHNTPVTVAAETGIVGVGLFLCLLVALGFEVFRGSAVRSLAGRTSLAAGLALAAILCHSLFYNDFFEDPTTWLLLGLVTLTAPRAPPPEEPVPLAEPKEAVPV